MVGKNFKSVGWEVFNAPLLRDAAKENRIKTYFEKQAEIPLLCGTEMVWRFLFYGAHCFEAVFRLQNDLEEFSTFSLKVGKSNQRVWVGKSVLRFYCVTWQSKLE